jgi:hypothetical protein
MAETANDLVLKCTAMARTGADFPTVWDGTRSLSQSSCFTGLEKCRTIWFRRGRIASAYRFLCGRSCCQAGSPCQWRRGTVRRKKR